MQSMSHTIQKTNVVSNDEIIREDKETHYSLLRALKNAAIPALSAFPVSD